ncbi:MAG: polysaccharide biosynthesis/export family protein [Oscillatoria sp. PMC 1051.18]|nr:polysaccharide biosynthesis/export family protein [Oscillatoria sp. PMC 1050.18]MEC5030115.1 polysaccharide biosynthesis/export family protein [Oscillatoria sp. PMC 1051.18]
MGKNDLFQRQIKAVTLVSLEAIASLLPLTLLFGFSNNFTQASIAQTLPPVPLPPLPYEQTPTLPPIPETFGPGSPIPPTGVSPQPFEFNPSNQFSRYRLGIGDAIAVIVPRFPEFNFQGVINLEGDIVMPILGRISLVGLTLEEAEAKIRFELARRFLREEPVLNVALAAPRPAQITLAGEIFRPGYYPLQAGIQLTSAILTAGGVTNQADLRSILVRRTLIDGTIIEQEVDLYTPLQNGTSLPNLRLQDGDAVIVSRLEVGTDRDYDRTLVARSSIAEQQITIRVLSYPTGRIGAINLPNGSNFLDALTAIAPSPNDANLSEIALIRYDPEEGKALTQILNGKRALRGDLAQNVPLQDNDVIVVGRSLVAKITYALSVFTQPFRDILGFLLFFDSLQDSARELFGPGADVFDNDNNNDNTDTNTDNTDNTDTNN